MKAVFGRVALATALVGLALPLVASADTLELSADQPTLASSLDSGLEGQAKAAPASGDRAVYIVQLGDPALATYDGGIGNMKATSNRMTGSRRLNVNSKDSKAYSQYLKKSQAAMVAACEVAVGHDIDVRYEYQAVFNGVAMALTEAEAQVVAAAAGVKNVSRERMEVPLTDAGPQWIGAPSIWSGPPNDVAHSRGEGTVIAVLDTGINSDHPSYADIGGDGYDHTNPLGSGNYLPGSHCDTVDPSFCNDKLIGAWDMTGPDDGPTPEDTDGHGSHTASTAGGNVVLGATLGAPTTNLVRDISGVAPHANLIMYDVCIDTCPGSALLAAINQVVIDAAALPDGIHSLNYSISGGTNPYNDPVELGFLNATAAGVYVSASAGNSGPGPATVAHLGPWVSTTAASTHDRTIPNSVVGLGSDAAATADITGLGLTSGYGPAPIVYAGDFPTANGSLNDSNPAQCLEPFPAGHFNGEIVVCDRGAIARVAKGANVLAGGAGGFVLANVDSQGESIVGDAHFLPGVHIGDSDGDVLRAWLAANTGTTASITGFSVVNNAADGDVMAGFSSRGPNNAFGVLKPDLSAPGVSIFAAEANGQATLSPEYQFLSGTSMSSPHNAGAGALMSAVQPDWSPYEIRSALMMTAERNATVKEDGSTPTDPFDVGAGRIDLSRAQEAGLVLDETPQNFLDANPEIGGDPTTLNLASMQDNVCVGTCSWTRTVENVTGHSSRWDLSTTGPEGLDLSVNPDHKLKLKKGKSGEITVTADTALAAPGWNFGTLELERKGDGPDLHMPIAVFAANSSNPDLLNKTVDAATAAEDEPLNYEITITNGPVVGQIDLTDALPDGLEFVAGSETEVVTNGTTISPFSHGGGTLNWSGTLDPGGLQLKESGAPLGFFSISRFVAPFGCPGNCDDGAFVLNIPSFVYNGQTYSQVIWSVNGTLEAGSASGSAASAGNQNLPSAAGPNNLMAPFWTDLNMGSDGDGAEWYVGVFNVGLPDTVTIYEWNNIPLFNDTSRRYSFQIWVQNGSSGNIWFTYGQIPDVDTPSGVTVGVENETGTVGSSYFFEGAGTAPAVGTDLMVEQLIGGSATFGFQAVIDDCDEGDAIVNRVNLSGATEETAIAVTQCVDDDDDDDDDSDSDSD